MREMWRRLPPVLWSFVAAMAVLLPLLAIFQYRWVGQLGEAERERMNALLQSAASQFSQDFDGEISRVYSVFQLEHAAEVSILGEDFAQRHTAWEGSTSYPQLIRGVFLAETDEHGDVRLMQLDRTRKTFDLVGWPTELAALRERVMEPAGDVIWEDIPALVIPPKDSLLVRNDTDSPSAPHLVVIVQLDLNVIRNVLLPELVSRYFPNGNGLSYNVAIGTNRSAPTAVFESHPGLLATGFQGALQRGLFDLRLETVLGRDDSGNRTGPGNLTHRPVLVRIIKPSLAGGGQNEELRGRWRLLVNYQPGALEDKIATSRGRNLAIGFGTLVLLAVSIALLIVSSARATRLAKDQLRFVAGVTHDLRTPLAVICSAGENLADGVVSEPDKVREYGRVIRDDGRRLTETMERVLEYAGAQSGRFVYELRDSDIAEVCKAAVADLQHEIDNAGFTVETKIEANLPKIRADADALKRALQNLISNAIKYRRGQPRIVLSAQSNSNSAKIDELQIQVADHGRGIPKSELPHIFEPFFRGADITAAQIPGSGLGLSLVQHTVASHGGRVSVESTFGEGSSFTIHLPFPRPADPHENA